jgi:glycosyltransferase involved in cell wall biosynthesis
MRIGVDGRELTGHAWTGIGRYLVEVVRAASVAGHETVVYGDGRSRLDPLAGWAGVETRTIDAPCTSWWDQVALPRRLARDGADVFLSPYYKGPLAAPCPLVLTIHDLYFIGYLGRRRPLYDAVATALARLYARRAAAVVADSTYSRRAIVDRLGVAAAKVHVIGVAVASQFQPCPSTPAGASRSGIDGPYVLYVGNFRPHKNLGRLVRAWAALSPRLRASHRLVLAGGDPVAGAGLARLAADLGVQEHVVLPGRIADADLPGLYGGAAVCVLASLDEGFGLPAVEAMAAGAPVIVSDRGALPETAGDAAVVVDAESVPALAGAIARVLDDDALAADLRRRGRERARHFAPAQTSARVVRLLEDVARQRARRAGDDRAVLDRAVVGVSATVGRPPMPGGGATTGGGAAITVAHEPAPLARGASGLARGASGLARGASGLARGASGLARGASGLARGASGLARGASGLARGPR